MRTSSLKFHESVNLNYKTIYYCFSVQPTNETKITNIFPYNPVYASQQSKSHFFQEMYINVYEL